MNAPVYKSLTILAMYELDKTTSVYQSTVDINKSA